MKSQQRIDKEKYWREQVAKAEGFTGPASKFCKAHNLSEHLFFYWRQKFATTQNPAKALVCANPFAAVKVNREISPSRVAIIPDAKWVAEFILHLHVGFR